MVRFLKAHFQVWDNLKDIWKCWKVLFISLKKLLSFWRYLNFCSDFFGHVGNGFISKLILISNFMASEIGKQIITIHISSNISRSKGNQTMKFCQLIEYNIRNTFLEKWHKTHREETSPGPFSKKQKLSISLDCCMSKSKLSKCIETKPQTTFFYLI